MGFSGAGLRLGLRGAGVWGSGFWVKTLIRSRTSFAHALCSTECLAKDWLLNLKHTPCEGVPGRMSFTYCTSAAYSAVAVGPKSLSRKSSLAELAQPVHSPPHFLKAPDPLPLSKAGL